MIPDRIARVGELLKREISNIIQQELQDPRIGFVTVTKVTVTRDLKQANIWISVFKDGIEAKQASLKAITHARNRIQNCLAHRVKLRYLPQLQFRLDAAIEYNAHIDEIIERLHKEEGREDNE